MSISRIARCLCISVLLIFLCSCVKQIHQPVTGVLAQNGIVSSAHPAATKVGLDILKQGGNAFDAAIAVQFALAVTHPSAGNIGGGGFLVYRKADGTVGSLDFREKAPLQAHRDMYLDENGEVITDLSIEGHLAAGVPGTVDGMFQIHEKLGSLPIENLIEPAILLAQYGVVLTEKEASGLNRNKQNFIDLNHHLPYLVSDNPWQAGDTIFHPELAQTLTRISENGRDGFYKGPTAEMIVDEMERGNGFISMEDLAGYQSVWRNPVVGHYKSYRIVGMPPPSSGGVALLQLLMGIESYHIRDWGFNTTKTVHVMTELERRVYADRAAYLGDPDFFQVPVDELINEEYLASRFSDISTEAKTSSETVKGGLLGLLESPETTHFSIVDHQGNAVAITTTINGSYGSKVMVEGAGFLLNNEMDDFSAKPGIPNMFGLIGGEANAIEPGKRMLSSMTPTIIEKEGALYMVVGTPGGSTIITSVFQTILNVIEHGMTMQEAVDAGKFHHQWLPDDIKYEPHALQSNTLAELEQLGHELTMVNSIGRMDAILVLDNGWLEGAADHTRGDNTAMGY